LNGLRTFKIGLDRNTALKKMPLPLRDMSNIMSAAGQSGADQVIALANDIQNIVFDNALRSRTLSESIVVTDTAETGGYSEKESSDSGKKPKEEQSGTEEEPVHTMSSLSAGKKKKKRKSDRPRRDRKWAP